jgi:hypothetical protein
MKEDNVKWAYIARYNAYVIFDNEANIDDIDIYADRTEENTKSIEIIVAELNKILTEK